MKLILLWLSMAIISITPWFSQNKDASDQYTDAKKIIADREKIANPKGIQKTTKSLGGLK